MSSVLRDVPEVRFLNHSTDGSDEYFLRRTSGLRFLDLKELWAHRELLYFLTWRNIKVRYKQTTLGIAWVILQPLVTMVAYTLLFGRLAKMPSDGVPYPLFAFAGLLAWQFFARSVSESTSSLLSNQQLVTRVYFPRISLPVATTLAAGVDFAISIGLLVILMWVYKIVPTSAILWLPVFILLLFISALGVGFWLSALNAQYRDVAYAVPLLTQLWFYLTPVVYPDSVIPERWRILYELNPMTGVVKGFRWALLGAGGASWRVLGVSVLVSVVLFVSGALLFRNRERTFVDVM